MVIADTSPVVAWTTVITQQHRISYPSSRRNSSFQSKRWRRDAMLLYSKKKDGDGDDDDDVREESRGGGSWRDLLPFGKDEDKKDAKEQDKKKNADENPLGIAMGWMQRTKDGDDGGGSRKGDENTRDSEEVEAKKGQRKQQRKMELLAAKQKLVKSNKKESSSSTVKKEEKDESLTARVLETVSPIKSMFSAMMYRDDDAKLEKDKEKKRRKQQQQSSKSSPLSVVQKFFQSDDEEWVTVFPKTRIMPGQQVPVTVAGIDLLVVASNDGRNRLYCIANACPHLGTPLETGQLVRLPAESSTGSGGSSASSSKTRSSSSSNKTATQQQPSSVVVAKQPSRPNQWTELEVSSILQQDGCENCIVCPLHRTAFALESGEVRGEWCPYPPIIGKMVGIVKEPTPVATFDIRTKGKDVQVRINSPRQMVSDSTNNATDGQ
jgi:nitrite reductase/ring-hydroxylating ferredoxin subunit